MEAIKIWLTTIEKGKTVEKGGLVLCRGFSEKHEAQARGGGSPTKYGNSTNGVRIMNRHINNNQVRREQYKNTEQSNT